MSETKWYVPVWYVFEGEITIKEARRRALAIQNKLLGHTLDPDVLYSGLVAIETGTPRFTKDIHVDREGG